VVLRAAAPRLRGCRYSPHYRITPEELAWVAERIGVLQGLVKAACEARLAALAAAAGAA
jgi:uncharacterized protein